MEEIIKQHRPNLSQSTIKTYLSCISNIRKGTKLDLESPKDFITHSKEILEYLSSMKPAVRKTKLASVVVLLDDKKKEQSDELKHTLELYRKKMMADVKIYDKDNEDQELSESQKEAFIPWEDVLKKYEELKSEVKPLWKKENLSQWEFRALQDYVLLSCYVLIDPRRSMDFSDFKIRNFDNITLKSRDNFMEVPKNKKKPAEFVFNSYKNWKKLGQQKIEIPKELKKIISDWSNINKTDYLIVNSKSKKIGQEGITKILNRIFGKNISSSMLRHIYLTHKYGDVNLKDLNETAKNMGSKKIDTVLSYVQKDAKELSKEDKET